MGNTRSSTGEGGGFWQKAGAVLGKIGYVLKKIGEYLYRFRKFLMAIPVVVGSVYLAWYSQQNLPQTVGLFLQSNGEYAVTVTRQVAVFAPVALTGICLLLMFCSRRALYPWLISLFSLVVPVFLLACNALPAALDLLAGAVWNLPVLSGVLQV